MRIDASTHFIPKRFFEEVLEAGGHKDIGKRVREVPSIHDLDVRLRLVDSFADYAQILSYSVPPIEVMVEPGRVETLTRMLNDGLAEIVRRYPEHFPGFVAQAALAAPDAGVAEAERAIRDLGALGVSSRSSPR